MEIFNRIQKKKKKKNYPNWYILILLEKKNPAFLSSIKFAAS